MVQPELATLQVPLITVFAKPVIVCSSPAFPARHITPRRTGAVVVVDPLICGFETFVD